MINLETTDRLWRYIPHDTREAVAIDSLVPYFRDRVIKVLARMRACGQEPYCIWGFRVWGTLFSKHKKGKACDIISWDDLHEGGNGWSAPIAFWQVLARYYTENGIFSGSVWTKKYGILGDKAHGEWRGGKVAKIR